MIVRTTEESPIALKEVHIGNDKDPIRAWVIFHHSERNPLPDPVLMKEPDEYTRFLAQGVVRAGHMKRSDFSQLRTAWHKRSACAQMHPSNGATNHENSAPFSPNGQHHYQEPTIPPLGTFRLDTYMGTGAVITTIWENGKETTVRCTCLTCGGTGGRHNEPYHTGVGPDQWKYLLETRMDIIDDNRWGRQFIPDPDS